MTERNSILCPNCRRLISTDESRCPYCGLTNPGSRWKSNFWTSGLRDPDQIVKLMIYVNSAMFLLSLILNPRLTSLSLNPFALLSPSSDSLLLLGATGTVPIAALDRWWTLISASYLHAGILHILFNMMALRQIAPLVIQEYGSNRMIVIYTLGGVLGYMASYLAGIPFTVGASAAVCALIGSAIYYGKSRGGYYGQEIFRQVGGWAIGIFAFGFLVPGINNWAHGGGLAGGALLGLLLGYRERRPETFFHKILGGLCVLATILILGWAVLSGIFRSFMS